MLGRLADEGLTDGAEVSVKLSAVGQALPGDGTRSPRRTPRRSRRRPLRLGRRSRSTWRTTPPPTSPWIRCASCERTSPRPARCCRPTCTAPRVTAATWRRRFAGAAVQGRVQRAGVGGLQERADVDRSYVRCMKVLLAGDGYPMFATHDQRLIAIAEALDRTIRAEPGQLRVPDAVRRPAATSSGGWLLRVRRCGSTSPTAAEWYGYLVRRMAERPANLILGARAILGSG